MAWQRQGFLENTVFDAIAMYIFPQLELQSVNPIIDLEINKTSFTVSSEQGMKL